MRTIIIDPDITGHHLEFNVNIFKESKDIQEELIFIFGHNFKELALNHYNFELAKFANYHSVKFIPKWFQILLNLRIPAVLRSFLYALMSLFYIKKFNADKIIFLYVNNIFRSFFILPKSILISGIIFSPISFCDIKKGIKRFIFEKFIGARNVSTIFVLNDKEVVKKLNEEYGLTKFKIIPDPIFVVNTNTEKIGNTNKIILLFIGSISARKGILKTIEALITCDATLNQKVEIRIIGKVSAEYENRFKSDLERIEKLEKQNIIITFFDKFVNIERFVFEIKQADYVMLTYDLSNASSGVLGYSMLYDKNIITSDIGYFRKETVGYPYVYLAPLGLNEMEKFFKQFEFRKSNKPKLNVQYLNSHSYLRFMNILIDRKL